MTWTDVPRCIEHEPGDDRQIPGVCPGISGYCSQGYLGQGCEFPCPNGPSINSTCTIDGTWLPYPTCLGDIRETQDGCNPCPGPNGAARKRPIEGSIQRLPVDPTAQLDPTDTAPRPTFAGTKSFGTSVTSSSPFLQPQQPSRPISPRLQNQNLAANSQRISGGQFQTQQQQQQQQPRSFSSPDFNAFSNFESIQNSKQFSGTTGQRSPQFSGFVPAQTQAAAASRNLPESGLQFRNIPTQSQLGNQAQDSNIAQAPIPPLPSFASSRSSDNRQENTKLNPLRARQSRPSPQTVQTREQVKQAQQPQVSAQPQQPVIPSSSNGGIPLSQGRFVVGSDGSIDARRRGQEGQSVQLTNEERSILRTSLPSATASKVRSRNETPQRQSFEAFDTKSLQDPTPTNDFVGSSFSSSAFNGRSQIGSVRDRESSFGPFQVVNL